MYITLSDNRYSHTLTFPFVMAAAEWVAFQTRTTVLERWCYVIFAPEFSLVQTGSSFKVKLSELLF